MTPEELRTICGQHEGLKLDFKREYKLYSSPPEGVSKQNWSIFVKGQWDEFIKDILALTNGNSGTADQSGLLIIGVDDDLLPDRTRNIYDSSFLQLSSQQILTKVNNACNPPIPQIICDFVELDGKKVCIICIPPSPFVHETTRELETTRGEFDAEGRLRFVEYAKHYSAHTVFIRRGEDIYPATHQERQKLEEERTVKAGSINSQIRPKFPGAKSLKSFIPLATSVVIVATILATFILREFSRQADGIKSPTPFLTIEAENKSQQLFQSETEISTPISTSAKVPLELQSSMIESDQQVTTSVEPASNIPIDASHPVPIETVPLTSELPASALMPTVEIPSKSYDFNDWSFAIDNVELATSIGDEAAAGTYVVVILALRNNATTARQLGTGFFQITDEQGRIYEMQSGASLEYHQTYNTDAWHYEDIGPSFEAVIPLTFDVSPDATKLNFQVKQAQEISIPILDAIGDKEITLSGHTYFSNDWEFSVEHSEVLASIDDEIARGKFLVIVIKVKNLASVERSIGTDFFVVKDDQDRIYEMHSGASLAYYQTYHTR